jgi:hypothetical protein
MDRIVMVVLELREDHLLLHHREEETIAVSGEEGCVI